MFPRSSNAAVAVGGSPNSSAERYAQIRYSARIHDRALFAPPRNFSELELQARWFAGDFGRKFTSTAGEEVEVVQFGTWNRAAGPDFSDASIRIGGKEIIGGDIEFDLTDRNWETHGHATNRDFDRTVLHVFVDEGTQEFFSRTSAHRNVPQVRIDPTSLPAGSIANLPLARAGRCHAPLRDLAEEKVRSILESAAQFRLERKARRLARLAEAHGFDEAIFQELAAALGYKENKFAFTLLAQRLPLKTLRASPNEIEAVLFGLAGFLAAPDLARFAPGTRGYLRELWEKWWTRRSELQRLVLPPRTWRLSGTRPLNHPQRRLAALAVIAGNWPRFQRSLGKENLDEVGDFFRECAHPYWSFHYTVNSAAAPNEMALIGESRITEIFANVVLPARRMRGRDVWNDYTKLPARLTNRRLETGAARLFADDPRRGKFLRTVAHQQGLLQIYEDFCLPDNSDCAQCPFPEQMAKWT